MGFDVTRVPVPRQVYRSFYGPDPWEGGAPTEWLVVGYEMLPAFQAQEANGAPSTSESEARLAPNNLVTGICSNTHRRYRILPTALEDVWRARQVSDELLPSILHRTELDLDIRDYPGDLAWAYTIMVMILCGVFSLIFFVSPWLGLSEAPLWGFGFGALTIAVLGYIRTRVWAFRRRRYAERFLKLAQSLRANEHNRVHRPSPAKDFSEVAR